MDIYKISKSLEALGLKERDKVLIALSGGVDSLSLAYALKHSKLNLICIFNEFSENFYNLSSITIEHNYILICLFYLVFVLQDYGLLAEISLYLILFPIQSQYFIAFQVNISLMIHNKDRIVQKMNKKVLVLLINKKIL